MFFGNKTYSASNSDPGVFCLAPSLTTLFPHYLITKKKKNKLNNALINDSSRST